MLPITNIVVENAGGMPTPIYQPLMLGLINTPCIAFAQESILAITQNLQPS